MQDKLAYWVSQIGSPPVMGLVGGIICILAIGTLSSTLWATLYIVLSLLLPTLYLLWLLRQGKVTDLHLHVREERIRPTIVTILGTLLAWGILTVVKAPLPIRILVVGQAIQVTIFC